MLASKNRPGVNPCALRVLSPAVRRCVGRQMTVAMHAKSIFRVWKRQYQESKTWSAGMETEVQCAGG